MQGNHQNLSSRLVREEGFVWPASAFIGVISARAMAFLADLVVLVVITFAFFIAFTILGIFDLWPALAGCGPWLAGGAWLFHLLCRWPHVGHAWHALAGH